MRHLLVVLASLLLPTGTAHGATPFKTWTNGLHRACPSRNVELLSDGAYPDFLDGFAQTLPHDVARRFDRVADIRKQCATEQIGFYCEMDRSLYAAKRLGLMQKLVLFGCRTVKCEQAALCSRFPGRGPENS
jgi:hypothetical protein